MDPPQEMTSSDDEESPIRFLMRDSSPLLADAIGWGKSLLHLNPLGWNCLLMSSWLVTLLITRRKRNGKQIKQKRKG